MGFGIGFFGPFLLGYLLMSHFNLLDSIPDSRLLVRIHGVSGSTMIPRLSLPRNDKDNVLYSLPSSVMSVMSVCYALPFAIYPF